MGVRGYENECAAIAPGQHYSTTLRLGVSVECVLCRGRSRIGVPREMIGGSLDHSSVDCGGSCGGSGSGAVLIIQWGRWIERMAALVLMD